MFAITHFGSFLLAATLVIIVPGPATLLVISSMQQSSKQAKQATLGIVCGDIVLITLSGVGVASTLAQWPGILYAIKLIGACYLLYLGTSLIWQQRKKESSTVDIDNSKRKRSAFNHGLLLTLTNPKPILFFAGFFPLFIVAGTMQTVPSYYALGLIFEMLNSIYFASLIIGVTSIKDNVLMQRVLTGGLNAISGWIIAGCGAYMLGSQTMTNLYW